MTLVPTYIPSGYRVSQVTAEPGSYSIDYKNSSNGDLIVQMASDGIGDVILDTGTSDEGKTSSRTVKSPVLPTADMQILTSKGRVQFAIGWLDLGDAAKPRFASIIGDHISAAVGVKIWQGLRYLKH
jgi:hypothetical protein